MTAVLYWLTFAGYLLVAAFVWRLIPSRRLWLQVAVVIGLGVVGAFMLLPGTCRSLMMRVCSTESSLLDCSPSGDKCSTLVGLDVPYADAVGVASTRTLGVLLILAGIAVAVVTGLVWRSRSRQPR